MGREDLAETERRLGVRVAGVFLNESTAATHDEIAAQINAALLEIEAGTAEIVEYDD